MSTESSQGVKTLVEEYIQDGLLRGKTEKTLNTYEDNITYSFHYLDCTPEEVGKNELRELLYHLREEKRGRNGKGLADKTINVYYSSLNSFYDFLKYEGYVDSNPIPAFRTRYLQNLNKGDGESRQLISVSEMAGLVASVLKTRDKAIILVLAKTGIRRGELVSIDVDDIDWEKQSIKLKQTPKRSNRTVYFDSECARVLKNWEKIRNEADPNTQALFINREKDRLQRNGVYNAVTKHAEKIGLHDPDADSLDEKFSPHCCRHWFTTHLRRADMKREYVKELRGDSHQDSMDDYNHIDHEKLRESYLTHIPQLNV